MKPPLSSRHFALLLSAILCGALAWPAQSAPYQEPWRPQFHFTPPTNWMNDPNGLVYYEGEYHLFYQYNPFGDQWGHMSWGHAVSKDLARWEHLPVALYEENDVMIFSGSAVIDWQNTSGFGRQGRPPMVAIYTGHYTKQSLQNQHIAYSNDRGRTWTKYAGNPVLDIGERDFRDPKVLWHEPTKRWVMTVALPTHRKVQFYASPNLKDWTHLSDFGPAGSTDGIWECPDLFPLRVEGRRGAEKWVLLVSVSSGAPAGVSGGQYFVGDFDGKHFTLDESYPKPLAEFVPEGTIIADFEGDDYAGWRATGTAFGTTPARGTLPNQQSVSGFRGRGLVNTYLSGDASEGTLTSPGFAITRDHLSFLIGGGNHAGRTCLNLVVDGRVVRTATGNADERLAWKSWDVRELRGKTAALEIVDRHTGGWGHINVDHILLADTPARPATQPALWTDHGPDFYAAVTWSDLPRRDGRRLLMGWMSSVQYAGDVPTSPWRSAQSIPRELTLRETTGGLRLVHQPARELTKLRGARHRLGRATLTEANAWLQRRGLAGSGWEIELEIEPHGSRAVSLEVLRSANEATVITCDPAGGRLVVDRTRSGKVDFHPRFTGAFAAPLPVNAGRVTLRLFVDTSSVEVFGPEGRHCLSVLTLPTGQPEPMRFTSTEDRAQIRSLKIWKLNSIW